MRERERREKATKRGRERGKEVIGSRRGRLGRRERVRASKRDRWIGRERRREGERERGKLQE